MKLTEFRVAAVAEGARLGMLATAPSHGLGFGNFDLHRDKLRPFVRPVAKGLGFGLATTAPIRSARLGGLNVR